MNTYTRIHQSFMGAADVLTGGAVANNAVGVTNAGGTVVAPGAVAVSSDAGGGTVVDTKWLGDAAPDEVKGYVQNKGWKSPLEVLDGYRNLEKLVGEHRLALPKDEKDDAAWSKVYDTLGRPKTAAEYKLPVPEGADPKFAGAASEAFHKLGLSAKQAQGIATWWNETTAAGMKAQQDAQAGKGEQELAQLQTKWGGAYNERVETARRAIRTFGVDAEMANKLEGALGSGGLMEFMHKIGYALGEHKAEGMDGQVIKGALTPDQAKAEIERLKKDAEWGKKYVNGDAEARARMQQLNTWAYPS